MKISELKRASLTRLRRYGKRPYQLAFYVFGLVMAAQILMAGLSVWVSTYQGGEGLDGMGSAALLETVEELLSTVVEVFSPLWTMGFTAAMMVFMDWQEPENKVLLTGIRRWWSFLKLYLLEGILVTLICFVVIMPVSYLYALSPWADALADLPNLDSMSDAEFLMAAFEAAAPMLIIYGLVLLAVLVPLFYRLRFAQYLILQGWIGVMNAMTTSFALTKGRVWSMVKLDLSYWWYYLAVFALSGGYLAVSLLELNMHPLALYGISTVIYAASYLALSVFATPRIQAANVLLYRGAVGKD